MQVHTPCLMPLPPASSICLHLMMLYINCGRILGSFCSFVLRGKLIFFFATALHGSSNRCVSLLVCACVSVGRWVVGGPTAAVIMIVCVSKQQQQQHQEQHQLLLCLWFPSVSRRVTVYLFIYLFSFASNRFCLQVDTTRSLSLSLSCSVSFADNLYTHHAALTSDLH